MTLKRIILPAVGLAMALGASAVPAMRGLRPVQQADGSTIMIERVGDESRSFVLNADGALLRCVDGMYRLADISADGRLTDSSVPVLWSSPELQSRIAAAATIDATSDRLRVASGVGTIPNRTFPRTGEQKAIVLLVQYQDVKFTLDDPYTYFNNMLNQEGFSDPVYGGTGSCRDYFIEASGGRFVPQFDVFGPITLPRERAFYGADNSTRHDPNAPYMALHACQMINSEVDFTQYDRDGDGYIDNVFIFYAGQGQASYGPEDSVWPHASKVGGDTKFDGKILSSYGCTNEWLRNSPDGIGTFCHEFGHVLGLPDLYHTVKQTTYTPGEWSIMDYGPYNNNSRTPPTMSSFERNALGWIDLKELKLTDGTITLPDLRTNNVAYAITNPLNEDEFFLFENRQQQGSDKYLPGHGMLVWHVKYDATAWKDKKVNNIDNAQLVDLVEADGKPSKARRTAADAFPGTTGRSRLAPKYFVEKDGYASMRLEQIAESEEGVITFDLAPAAEAPADVWSVDQVISFAAGGDVAEATVRGYIVGYQKNGSYSKSTAVFGAGTIATNLLLADSPDVTDWSYAIPVQLQNGTDARTKLNLKDNPDMLGTEVKITGKLTTYNSTQGIKYITGFEIPGNGVESAITEIEASGSSGSTEWYDLQGRRLDAPSSPGIYINSRGEKRILH